MLRALTTGQQDAGTIAGKAFAHGLLANAPRHDTLRFMPALTVTVAEIDRMIGIMEDILEAQA